jgi:Domain of unknown function (DUF4396)
MLQGVMFLWFLLAAIALLFVAIDIRTTPESPVLKWGFVLLTAYTGVVGAFLYVLGCREPLPGLHERYVAARWRQTLGSTMHCVAGDGVGILAGAVLASVLALLGAAEVIVEYVLGFAFGWMIFQALFMREMAGRSYSRSLTSTFIPELLSMNLLMAGMVPTVMALRMQIGSGSDPLYAGLLVCDVNRAAGRIRHRLSNELVASRQPSEVRHDDGAARGNVRHNAGSRRWHRCARRIACRTRGGGGSQAGTATAGASDGAGVVRCPLRRSGNRLLVRGWLTNAFSTAWSPASRETGVASKFPSMALQERSPTGGRYRCGELD